jgi:CHAT domain-containing protein
MAKLRGRAGADKRLIVSPDAALAEIPWETMRDGDAGRYLVEEGYQIRYLDSARSLVYPTRPAAFKGPAVVIAEVDYDGKQASPVLAADAAGSDWPAGETPAGEQMGTWKPLNGGAEILRTIRELNQAGKIGPMRKLPLGSEEEVMALEQPAALIAHTHGFFRASTAGLESGSDGLDSGVALYGANHASEPSHKGKDGLLMAEEAMLLNLEGTRLVALLGCDTGRGVEAGEGVQGFRHALSVAGARSTLLTLWEVGDLSIARFLREFMIRSSPASRMTVDEALAETQLAFLRGEIQEPNALPGASRWRHPYFWAAATLGGEDGLLDLELRK